MFAKVAQAVVEVLIIPIILSCASKISTKRNSKSQKDTRTPRWFWEKPLRNRILLFGRFLIHVGVYSGDLVFVLPLMSLDSQLPLLVQIALK
jgi:hypothetical protein